jgi:hypothetical protein
VFRPRPVFLTTASVAAGAALGAWLWRRWGYPVHEESRDVAHAPEAPPTARPEPPGRAPIQDEAEGTGPRFHRRYRVDVAEATKTPRELMACVAADVQDYVPDELATFRKTVGAPGRLAVGDEYDIKIRSPWDGPVRVVEAGPTAFTLATLDGHMEAGTIRFHAEPHPTEPGALRFTIESWARSRDAAVDLAYDTLEVAKEAQQAMWTFFCERVAEDCGGRRLGEIEVLTEREAAPDENRQRADG